MPEESEIRNRFRSMSDEEFSSIKRSDLTAEGQRAFDEELRQRGPAPIVLPQAPNSGSGVAQRIKRALGSIAVWVELVVGLGLIESFLRDIGVRLPQGVVVFCAFLLMFGVIWWRIKGGSIGDGMVLLKGLGILAVVTVVGLLVSFGVTFARTTARDKAESEISPMPIEHLVKLQGDRSFCDDMVKIQGTVRELNANETASIGGSDAYALEAKSASIVVVQNKQLGHPKPSEQLEVIGFCKCSPRRDIYDSNISRIIVENKRSLK